MEDENNLTFRGWLFSRHEIVEKTAGLVVLIVEMISLLRELYLQHGAAKPEDNVPITYVLNLLFLVFIFFYLKDDFAQRFSVDAENPRISKLLRLSHFSAKENRIRILEFQSNTFIGQLKNINYFLVFTACLYGVFILQKTLLTHHVYGTRTFHLVTDILSYLGAWYLLRCFYVMYLPTIDEHGNDILNRKTLKYVFIGLFLISFDAFTMGEPEGRLVSEYVCGVINAVVFILLIARFENKILDIPPIILCLLYVYAILQTCLPVVTSEITAQSLPKELSAFLSSFANIVLTLCLVGKIALASVLLYVLNTKRIFYYFMTLKLIHDEETKNWNEFSPLIESFSVEPEKFSIIYDRNPNATYTARIPALFDDVSGTGRTREESKSELLHQIKNQRQ